MAEISYTFSFQIQGPDDYSVHYDIPIGITTIGRGSDNLLRLNDKSISRHHARLECIAGECEITDLDSSNGVYVNGTRIPAGQPTLLHHGDQIKIGPNFEMSFSQEEVIVEEVQPPVEPVEETPEIEIPPISTPTDKQPPELPPEDEPPAPSPNGFQPIPPGLSTESHRLIRYLPEIYHTDKELKWFLAIFEAILFPIEWNIEHFNLFLSPKTAPSGFLPWLANWFGSEFDSTWTEAQRRTFLTEAHALYARRGTKWALSRVLEIYTGSPAEIDDLAEGLAPHTFRVRLTIAENAVNRPSLEAIIQHYKPVHTAYELIFQVQS